MWEITIVENNICKLNGVILHTDTIDNLEEQINTVNSSINVILTGGSPYFVNGIFCNHSTIIVLDDFVIIYQINSYIKLRYIHYKILEKNKVFFIKNVNNTFNYVDIENYF